MLLETHNPALHERHDIYWKTKTYLARVLLEQVCLAELLVGNGLVLDALGLESVVQRAQCLLQGVLVRSGHQNRKVNEIPCPLTTLVYQVFYTAANDPTQSSSNLTS